MKYIKMLITKTQTTHLVPLVLLDLQQIALVAIFCFVPFTEMH